MKFIELPLSGAYVVELEKKQDERGFFARFFCEDEFKLIGLNTKWSQINTSLSIEKYTLRGLHYQREPKTEAKLLRCINGSLFDVIVDLRSESDTYGKWCSYSLNETNRDMIYIPQGFAHGFMTTSNNTEILYAVSEMYSPEHEDTLLWSDPQIDIKWPHDPSFISEKDRNAKNLENVNPIKLIL